MLLLFLPIVLGEILLPITVEDSYKVITLSNSLQATIVSCKECSEAGVAMGVKVGSSHDTVPGIAHFVEHMLFFASETYPVEDYLTTFIDSNGGSTNAFTEYEATVYYYSISNAGLEKSLDIFSRMFAEPIFLYETAMREILAVNSEMQGYQYNDDWRIQKLIEVLAGKPLDHLTTGDINTLSLPNITDELYAFWDRHYRAENLKLAVYGNFSLEVLEEWVRDKYSDIRDGGEFQMIQSGSGLGNFAVGQKVNPGRTILMFWKIDPVDLEYQVEGFVGHLLQYSIRKTLADSYPGTNFYAGSFAELSSYTMFMIEILQSDSAANLEGLCSSILASVNSLASVNNETLYELWEDYKTYYYYKFYYSDPVEGYDLASTLAYNMLSFEEEMFFAGDSIKPKYSYEKFQNTLKMLTAEKVFTGVLTGDTSEFVMNSYDPGFDMEYSVSNWNIVPNEMLFAELEVNPYLPQDLELIDIEYTDELVQLENDTNRVWFKYNYSIKKPVVMISALVFTSNWLENKVLALVHCAIVLEKAGKELIYWYMAGYTLEIAVESPGVTIKVYGWNSGIFDFFSKVLELYTSPDLSRFDVMKEATISTLLYYENQDSYEKAIDYLSRLITKFYISSSEKYSLLLTYTSADYETFVSELPYANADVLVIGNTNPPNGISELLGQYFILTVTERFYRHSLGISDYKIFAASTNNENAILNWYEFGPYNPSQYSAVQILKVHIADQAYIELRSKAQLGYTVLTDYYDGFFSNGLYLIVQGSYYNPAQMQEYINLFWDNIVITAENVLAIKETIKSLSAPLNNYQEIHDLIWFEILIGRFGFAEMEKVISAMEETTLENVLAVLTSIQDHANELSIRMYVDLAQSTEDSISLDYYRENA